MQPNYKPPFAKFVKKQRMPLQLAIEDAVEEILENPSVGEQKSGDLRDIYVYKFKHNQVEYLVAYRPPSAGELSERDNEIELVYIDFYQVGTHENFYADLKNYLKSRGK
jgi:hypothetical protein